MAEPFKSDSGKRRSALTSAFEELALHTNNLNEVRPNSTARPPPARPTLKGRSRVAGRR